MVAERLFSVFGNPSPDCRLGSGYNVIVDQLLTGLRGVWQGSLLSISDFSFTMADKHIHLSCRLLQEGFFENGSSLKK